MCGITGILSKDNQTIPPDLIKKMNDTIRHRGPDGEGYVFVKENSVLCAGGKDTKESNWNNSFSYSATTHIDIVENDFPIVFGHRRLAIIDISHAGHQPMCSKDEQVWITYNGEIYNHIELKKELQKLGHHFHTHTDTEVLINAYLEWGEQCLAKLNGMWSFVIYDKRKNILFGARDRVGVKPFYYYFDSNYFAFASEQKALLTLPFLKKEINPKAVFDFFVLSKIETDEEGLFKNILELPPSHSFILKINNFSFQKTKYHHFSFNNQFEIFNVERAKEFQNKIYELVEKSVLQRLQSDVPVGTCLSGGIDSSTISLIINQHLSKNKLEQIGEQQKVFTACFSSPKFDESNWAQKVVQNIDAEWYQTFPTKTEFFQDIETLIYSQDIPIWSASTYAQHRVMRLAKENNIKVLLDGQGADELFGGYPHHYYFFWGDLLKNSKWKLFVNELQSFSSISFSLKLFLKNYFKYNFPNTLGQNSKLQLNKFYFDELKYVNSDLIYEHKNRIEEKYNFNSLNQVLHHEYTNNYLKGLLKCEDRASMWHSIESRTPFSDDVHLSNYVFSIPSNYKIKNGTSKYLLRESMKKILPKEILQRKDKMGFVTPNNIWIDELKDDFKNYFSNDLKEYLNIDLIHKEYNQLFSIKNQPENYRIFKFISFAIWKKVFNL